MKGFDGFQLKVMMVICMLIDHIAEFIPGIPLWFRYIGRLAAPVFCYLLVEGFIHTSSRKKYMKRLVTGGIIMIVGSNILTYIFNRSVMITNNIFLAMAVSIAILNVIEWKQKEDSNKVIAIAGIVGLFIVSLVTEGGPFMPVLALIFYYNRDNKVKLSLWYTGVSLMILIGPADSLYESLFIKNFQWMMVFALPFMLMYNGERGRKAKYFFYIFYPIHIWILYVLGNYIKF